MRAGDVEVLTREFDEALPVSVFHGLVGHQVQQRTQLVEVVDCLLERREGWPLLQALRQLATSVGGKIK